MSGAQHGRRQLNQVDVHLLHELSGVERHNVFDGWLLGDVLKRGHGAEVPHAFPLRNDHDLNVGWAVECGHACLTEEQLELIELLPLGHLHGHLYARSAVQLQRDAR